MTCCAPRAHLLHVVLCLFATAQLLVKSKALPLLAPVTARLEATYVQFKGRLNLGLLLGSEPPGIS